MGLKIDFFLLREFKLTKSKRLQKLPRIYKKPFQEYEIFNDKYDFILETEIKVNEIKPEIIIPKAIHRLWEILPFKFRFLNNNIPLKIYQKKKKKNQFNFKYLPSVNIKIKESVPFYHFTFEHKFNRLFKIYVINKLIKRY